MGNYEIKDAVMLKECMRIIAEIAAKYPQGAGVYLDNVPERIKKAIEFIQQMVAPKDTKGDKNGR